MSEDKPAVCLTRGEPMLHPQFFDIAGCVNSMGFSWGMTTNATLIDDVAAERLKHVGMSTVSVSLDGMEQSHDRLRRRQGAWKSALRGLRALQNAGFEPQVTTVLHRGNLYELDRIYELAPDQCGADRKSLRVKRHAFIARAILVFAFFYS